MCYQCALSTPIWFNKDNIGLIWVLCPSNMLRKAKESATAGGNFFVARAVNGRVQEENLKVQGAVYVQQWLLARL